MFPPPRTAITKEAVVNAAFEVISAKETEISLYNNTKTSGCTHIRRFCVVMKCATAKTA